MPAALFRRLGGSTILACHTAYCAWGAAGERGRRQPSSFRFSQALFRGVSRGIGIAAKAAEFPRSDQINLLPTTSALLPISRVGGCVGGSHRLFVFLRRFSAAFSRGIGIAAKAAKFPRSDQINLLPTTSALLPISRVGGVGAAATVLSSLPKLLFALLLLPRCFGASPGKSLLR